MGIIVIILSVTTVLFFGLALFLGIELLKKFSYMRRFVDQSGRLVTYTVKEDRARQRMMRNIVLRSDRSEPFVALIGFKFPFGERYDWFGYVEAKDGLAVFSTFMGKGGCEFQFLIGGDQNDVIVSMSDEDMELTPVEVYPPHVFQRIGIFG